VPYAFVAPAALTLAFVFAYPLFRVVDFSLRRVEGNSGTFVGLENYRLVLNDPTFIQALKHSALLLVLVPLLVVSSVVVAVLIYDRVRGWRFARSVVLLPYIIAVPIVGVVASYMFQFNGALNAFFRGVGLDRLAIDWLGSSRYALLTVMLVIVWREVGLGIVLMLARLSTIDESQLESATMDGANWFQRLRYVILPELRGTVELYVVISSITLLAWVFAYVWTITRGGPGTASTVVELYIYNQGVRNGVAGIASAAAVLLLAMTCLLIGLVALLRRRSGLVALLHRRSVEWESA
jgi:ABC-type sugar transport system permease subunit